MWWGALVRDRVGLVLERLFGTVKDVARMCLLKVRAVVVDTSSTCMCCLRSVSCLGVGGLLLPPPPPLAFFIVTITTKYDATCWLLLLLLI